MLRKYIDNALDLCRPLYAYFWEQPLRIFSQLLYDNCFINENNEE